MRAEKGGSKSGGIFHLFDWNKKSRKKLFSNGTVSPGGTKPGKKSEENLPTSRLHLIDEEEIVCVPSIKGISDYSCASSVTDEEGNETKAPGVVARLMGLESMPTSSGLEPYATPLVDRRSLRDNNGNKRSPEFCINGQFNLVPHRAHGFTMKPVELRSQKMPSSPVERFQMEALPPRFAKSHVTAHHKLFSPIKSPGFTSMKNAAQIMEAAAKILDPRIQASSKGKTSSSLSCSNPIRVCDPKEKSSKRLLQLSRRPVESTDIRLSEGQQLNQAWNSAEDIVIYRPSPYSHESNADSKKGKGKSISLAIQAKVNVQRREGLSSSCRNTGAQKDTDECRLNQPNNQKNRQQRKTSLSSASSVLRQNNQKQNCTLSTGKAASSKSISSQQGRKVMPGDASSGKQRSINKHSGNSRVGHRKDVAKITDEEESLCSTKDFPQKKRLIDRSFSNERSAPVDNKFVNRQETQIQPNAGIDEHKRWNKNNTNSTDVVSFTFTSPLTKQSSRGQSFSDVVENLNLDRSRRYYHFDAHSEKNSIDVKRKKSSSIGLNVITGDALSLLLEQKLREVTSQVEPSHNFIEVSSLTCSSSVTEPQASVFNSGDAGSGKSKGRSCKEKSGGHFDSCLSSKNNQMLGMRGNLHVAEDGECSSSSNSQKELDHQHMSPLSILDSSFSSGSYHSPESSGSSNGSKIDLTYSSKTLGTEAKMNLSNLTSFAFTGSSDVFYISNMSLSKRSMSEGLEYIRDILSFTDDLSSCYVNQAGTALDPLLFDRLASNRNRNKHEKEPADCTINRKLLFDCVKECLDSKCSIYFQAGYQAWAKGMMVLKGKEKDLAIEFWDVITGWKSMGDWMVDDLVEKDMNTQLGTWLDFRIEAFETGVDTVGEILNSLIDEMLGDIFSKV